MITRTKIPLSAMRDYLIDQTTDALRRDARMIAGQLVIRKREGVPNWDANIGIAPPIVLKAFGVALKALQREHDIEW
jgi:hypothetical protein